MSFTRNYVTTLTRGRPRPLRVPHRLPIWHQLGSRDVQVRVFDAVTDELVIVGFWVLDTEAISLSWPYTSKRQSVRIVVLASDV